MNLLFLNKLSEHQCMICLRREDLQSIYEQFGLKDFYACTALNQ